MVGRITTVVISRQVTGYLRKACNEESKELKSVGFDNRE